MVLVMPSIIGSSSAFLLSTRKCCSSRYGYMLQRFVPHLRHHCVHAGRHLIGTLHQFTALF